MIRLYALKFSVMVSIILAGLIQPAFAVFVPANGLTVSPSINNIQATTNQNSAVLKESVTNITNQILAVDLTTKDFSALNDYGGIGFYGSSYKPSSNPHGLSTAISIPSNEFLINPHQTLVIPININNINKLSPGGHYGAILFTPVIARSSHTSNQLNLQPSVASLIFLSTSFGGTQVVKLGGFSVSGFGFNLPSKVYVLLTDSGNTQIIPRGVLILKDPSSRIVTQSILNTNSGIILPATSRLFNISIKTTQNLLKLAGTYQLQLKYKVNGASSYQEVSKSFFYLNPIVFVYIVLITLIYLSLRRIYKKPKSRFKTKHK